MSKYNIHAGHNPAGKIACGAAKLLNESTENRLITKEVIRLLKQAGHTVYDCTCNNGKSQTDVLNKICAKCNKHTVDLDVSIHLNSGRNDTKGDKKVGGVEVLCTAATGIKKDAALRIRKNMQALGFTDRGTKTTSKLHYLNHARNKAILVEVCFVDDRDDYNLYKRVGYKRVARAIAEGITGRYRPIIDMSGVTPAKNPAVTPKPAAKPTTKPAKITGNGVRLRSKPSTVTGRVLESMYNGETVTVLATSGSWKQVKRDKTGTIGWASGKYIS